MNTNVQSVNAQGLPRQEDLAALRVLEEIERKPDISQREMSRSLGVSLGLTNLLIRKMVSKAWIKVSSIPGRRVLYALTPKGMSEKIRKTRDFVRLSFRYYSGLRRSLVDQIRAAGAARPWVATFGSSELSELVADAAGEAGGTYLGAIKEGHRLGSGTVLVLLDRPVKSQREHWAQRGISLIDLF